MRSFLRFIDLRREQPEEYVKCSSADFEKVFFFEFQMRDKLVTRKLLFWFRI